MGLGSRFIEALGGVTEERMNEATSRAYEQGFYDANDDPASGDIAAGGFGYKRISDKYVREGKIDPDRALEVAWTLWQKSPIAKRVLAMKRDHIIGHNAMPSTDDEELTPILDAFWKDNKLDKRASEFTIQLFGFGEQCFPAFVRESDGRVRLGYIDPTNIHKIEKHPENSLEDWAVVVQRKVDFSSEKRVYRIIREDERYVAEGEEVREADHAGKLVTWEQATLEPWEEKMLKKHDRQEYDGSCFYAKVNAASNQARGMSDLLQVADWIDQGDEVLFALADREQYAGFFSFEVTLDGADADKIAERRRYYAKNPPKKGSVNVHNESEEWNQWAPDLGQTGTIETFRAILGLILGGMGFPVHWYGFGDDANRATAVAQGAPTEKSLEHDQGIVKDLFLSMCRFAADQAEIAGTYTTADEEYDVMLNLPEVTVRDISRVTSSLGALAQALTNARAEGWITQETAVQAWAKILQELGIEIDPATELEAVAEERERQELEREQQRNNALQQAMDGNGQGPEGDEQSPEDKFIAMLMGQKTEVE